MSNRAASRGAKVTRSGVQILGVSPKTGHVVLKPATKSVRIKLVAPEKIAEADSEKAAGVSKKDATKKVR